MPATGRFAWPVYAAQMRQFASTGEMTFPELVAADEDRDRAIEDYLEALEDSVTAIGAASLWEEVAGDLHPVTDPDTFSITTTTAAGNDAFIFVSDGAFTYDPVTPGAGGFAVVADYFRVTLAEAVNFGTAGNEIQSFTVRSSGGAGVSIEADLIELVSTGALTDITLSSNEDIEMSASDQVLIEGENSVLIRTTNAAGAGVTITSADALDVNVTDEITIDGDDVAITAAGDLALRGAAFIRLGAVADASDVVINTEADAPADGTLHNGSVSAWLDEAAEVLKFKVKDSAGNIFTAEVPYV